MRPTKRPDNCVECGNALRSGSQSLDDYPGTVKYHGHGLCATCVSRGVRADERNKHPELNARQSNLKAFGMYSPLKSHFRPFSDDDLERIRAADKGFAEYIEGRRKGTGRHRTDQFGNLQPVPTEGWQYYVDDSNYVRGMNAA